MKRVIIELLEFNELEVYHQDSIIQDHKEFLVDIYQDDDFDESFNMTRSLYKASLTKEDIIEDITSNEYLFFPNGELASTVRYCGNHPQAGQHKLSLNNTEYNIID